MLIPDIEKEKLNARSIKSLGFVNYKDYVVKDTYTNASQYFRNILTKDDIVDLNKIDSRVRRLQTFSSVLYDLKSNYEIIEYEPNKYINFRRLLNFGIEKSSLINFSESVINFLGGGQYFTMASLRDAGFSHPLDDLGFDDWFYTSILIENKESICYLRIGRNKIMLTNNYDFNFEEFIENIIFKEEDLYMNIYDLDYLLKNKYKIFMEIYKLISIINSSTMHYDPISETVYGDYEIYYEVI